MQLWYFLPFGPFVQKNVFVFLFTLSEILQTKSGTPESLLQFEETHNTFLHIL